MSVVINGRFLRARTTGLQRVARSLLSATGGLDLDLEVIGPRGVSDPLVDRTTWSPPGRLGDHIWEQLALPRIAGDRPIVSLVNTAPVHSRCGVVMVHDLAFLHDPTWFRREMRLYGKLVVVAARRADVVLTVSTQVATELADVGVDPDRVRVIPNAVDPLFEPASDPDIAAARERFSLRQDYVLHIGWFDPRKDVGTAIAAHRLAAQAHPHDLVLIGEPHVNFRDVSLPADESIRRIGRVTDEDLRTLMTGAAAFLYPSRYEGFGLPPLEALACGTPALTSDLPALRESAGSSAHLLPVGDVAAWAEALGAALRGELTATPPPARTWSDAAAELSAVLRSL